MLIDEGGQSFTGIGKALHLLQVGVPHAAAVYS
jgi:hypothetical protein